jgi:aryl-alcohol dehydrogenase-like predicted oxidoreductase
METSQRREFLKKSILGISGAALLPRSMRATFNNDLQQSTIPELPVRVLGRTGIKTPLLSFGAGSANSAGLVKAAYFAGVKLFFSATYYGEGNNERLVGEALKGLSRDSFVVGTAVSPDGMDTRTGKIPIPFDVNAYVKKASVSLGRFGLDYIDILLFPYAGKRDVLLNESLLKAMQELKKQGLVRHIGLATHSNSDEALRAAADSKVYEVVMTAYNYKTDNKEAMNNAIAYAVNAGVGVVAMKTTAGVFDDKNKSRTFNSDAVLKWPLQNENISSIVSGMSSLDELQKNIAMLKNIRLTDQELKDLTLAGLENGSGLYCHQCRTCVPQCINRLEIPTIMRSYMYAYGYRNMEHARHTFMEAGLTGTPCANCNVCNVKCTAGFNIKERILDISRIRDVPDEFLKV